MKKTVLLGAMIVGLFVACMGGNSTEVAGDTTQECAFVQGEAMGRPSVVATHIQADGNIFVGGTATVVAEGILHV